MILAGSYKKIYNLNLTINPNLTWTLNLIMNIMGEKSHKSFSYALNCMMHIWLLPSLTNYFKLSRVLVLLSFTTLFSFARKLNMASILTIYPDPLCLWWWISYGSSENEKETKIIQSIALNQNLKAIKNSCTNYEYSIDVLSNIPLAAEEDVKRDEPCVYPCLNITKVKIGVYSHDIEPHFNVFPK